MFLSIVLSPLAFGLAVVGAAGGLLYLGYQYLCERELKKYYEAAVVYDQQQLKAKDDQLDEIFIQVLQWRANSEQYRELLQSLLPAIGNKAVMEVVTNLESQFKHLYQITETDRKAYMEQLKQQPDYSADLDKVVDRIVDKIAGNETGIPASNSPTLNANREN